MKRTLQFITSTSAASLLACAAWAQDTPNPRPEGAETGRYARDRAHQSSRLNGAAKASDLIGMDVKNYQGEKLGKIDDLAVDVASGRIVQVILSTGGFVGIGDTLHAVPPGALHHDVANKVVHLDSDKEKLTASPRFESSKWAECCDSNHVDAVYRQYGESPRFTFGRRGDDPESIPTVSRNENPNGDRLVNENDSTRVTGRPVPSPVDGKPSVTARNSEGTEYNDTGTEHHQSQESWSRLGQVQRASKIIGTAVVNLQDEKIGKVENLMVDLQAGRVVALILSSGGFLGMGDEMSVVPPTALRHSADGTRLQLDTSKEALTSAPHFKADQWPDLTQPTYADGVYRAYKVDPYFSTNEMTRADNTARNVRDRKNSTLTPLDQGNSKADVDTTAKIRKAIVAGEGMSVNAKNVKIMTVDGRVTLRGPVDSAEEKRLIGEIANKISQPDNVNNQLEVK